MSNSRKKGATPPPPVSWINWQAAKANSTATGAAEFAIFTDCRTVGELRDGIGPYAVLNTIPIFPDVFGSLEVANLPRQPQPITLRAHDHVPADPADPQSQNWLDNSTVDDEIAALLSLALGRRFRGGGLSRRFWFNADADPLGQPYEYGRRMPHLPQGYGRGLVIPEARSTANLSEAQPLLTRYGDLASDSAATVLRVSRAYRDGLWVAEGDPSEAWLRFVSAVETAGGTWTPGSVSNADTVRLSMPSVANALAEHGDEYAQRVSDLLADLVGSTRRFVAFLLDNAPAAPLPRPSHSGVDWTNLKPALAKAYSWRSLALHTGTPIPWGMSMPPMKTDTGGMTETAPGIGTIEDGIELPLSELPMLLSTFEYIARNALVRWWASL